MNELPPHAKQLLALARSADEPDDAARERVRRGVALAVGVGSAAAVGAASKAASASASATATAAKVGSSVAVKLALAGAVTVALGAGAWQLRPAQVAHERAASRPVAHAPSAAQKRAPAAQPIEQPAAPAPSLVQEPRREQNMRAPAEPRREQNMRAPAEPRRERDTEPVKSPNALHAEMTLLQAASTALDRGDLPRARELLKAHRQAHAAGQLRAERRGLEVLLHCIARDAGAGAAARAYLRAEPDGVLSARIAAACKPETPR